MQTNDIIANAEPHYSRECKHAISIRHNFDFQMIPDDISVRKISTSP